MEIWHIFATLWLALAFAVGVIAVEQINDRRRDRAMLRRRPWMRRPPQGSGDAVHASVPRGNAPSMPSARYHADRFRNRGSNRMMRR